MHDRNRPHLSVVGRVGDVEVSPIAAGQVRASRLERLRELADRGCRGRTGRPAADARDRNWCTDEYPCDPCAALLEYATARASGRA
jgi:hypothetical protein